MKQLTEGGTHALPAHFPEKFAAAAGDEGSQPSIASSGSGVSAKPKLARVSTITDLEESELKPRIRGRIKLLTPEVSFDMTLFNSEA